MTSITSEIPVDHINAVRLENHHLCVEVAPELGGRITRLWHKGLAREVLWRNPGVPLAPVAPGTPYDPHFAGGIDDILPCDLPEVIDGLPGPDHGEWWTLPLSPFVSNGVLELAGQLPLWGLAIRKVVSLDATAPCMHLDYTLVNVSGAPRTFLWKLHAALVVDAGDQIVCPARTATVADPAWSRWGASEPFAWPSAPGGRADQVPAADGTTDFLFLSAMTEGSVGLHRPMAACAVTLTFDRAVFPYVCVFASYGGFGGYETVILEPCTAMPLSVVEAARLGQCSQLAPGARLTTRVSIAVEALG